MVKKMRLGLDENGKPRSGQAVSRRRFLRAAGAAAAGWLVGGCAPDGAPTPFAYGHTKRAYGHVRGAYRYISGAYSHAGGGDSHVRGAYRYISGAYSHVRGVHSHAKDGYCCARGGYRHAPGDRPARDPVTGTGGDC